MMNSTYLAELASPPKRIYTFLATMAMALLFTTMVKAQEAQALEDFLAESDPTTALSLSSYVYENVPTYHWKTGRLVISTSPNAPKLTTDVASLGNLNEQNSQNRTVKFLQINVENAGEKAGIRLSPSSLSSFVNLQYILVKSQVPLSQQEVTAMVSGYQDGDIVLLYQVNSNF